MRIWTSNSRSGCCPRPPWHPDAQALCGRVAPPAGVSWPGTRPSTRCWPGTSAPCSTAASRRCLPAALDGGRRHRVRHPVPAVDCAGRVSDPTRSGGAVAGHAGALRARPGGVPGRGCAAGVEESRKNPCGVRCGAARVRLARISQRTLDRWRGKWNGNTLPGWPRFRPAWREGPHTATITECPQ